MTDQDLIDSSRELVAALEMLCEQKGVTGHDRVAFASMALPEFLAQHLGPVGAIEHLRTLADHLERQFLN